MWRGRWSSARPATRALSGTGWSTRTVVPDSRRVGTTVSSSASLSTCPASARSASPWSRMRSWSPVLPPARAMVRSMVQVSSEARLS